MLRWEEKIFIKPNGYKCYEEYNSYIRPQKHKLKIKECEYNLNLIYLKIKSLKKMYYQGNVKEINFKKNLLKYEKEILKEERKLEKMKNIDILDVSHKCLKPTFKKKSFTTLKTEILKIIEECKLNKVNYIQKEDIALRCHVKEKFVEQIFMQLNREGILSQAKHLAPHDSRRDPNGFDSNAWGGDIYTIC